MHPSGILFYGVNLAVYSGSVTNMLFCSLLMHYLMNIGVDLVSENQGMHAGSYSGVWTI